LIDKVWSEKHLGLAAQAVLGKDGAAGVDGQSRALVEAHLNETVAELSRLLKAQLYEPRPVKRVWIDRPGSNEKRPLGIPTVRGRVVQTALPVGVGTHLRAPPGRAQLRLPAPGPNAHQAITR
jgi:RNA-directed DNA polymerase